MASARAAGRVGGIQALAALGASKRASRRSSSLSSESEAPGISNAVRKVPTSAASILTPAPCNRCKAWRATMLSSCTAVPPRLLTSKATRSDATIPPRSIRRSSSWSSMTSAGAIGPRRAPLSPWMPRPYSTSSSPRSKPRLPAAGTMQAPSPSPMLNSASLAASASALTSASDRPASAAAPATLCTSTVPAMPRRPTAPPSSASATSSRTITSSTPMPDARAISAARPKLSRSPV